MNHRTNWLSKKASNEIGDLIIVLVSLSWAAGVIAGYVLRLTE